MIQTTEILCSINPQNSRLMTMLWRYPKFLHQESLRHRTLYIQDCLYDPDFSFSVSSARAIPFAKLLSEVRDDNLRAKPEFWGAEQKGMSPGDEIDNPECAKMLWGSAAQSAANWAEELYNQGIHKSICNRIIEPYIHVNCLVTGTDRGWMNFFGLRLDKATDPTLQILAESAWRVWQESKPKLLQPDVWHLPLLEEEDFENILEFYKKSETEFRTFSSINQKAIKISAARCARLSYLSFSTKKRSTIEEDLELYNKLVGGEIIHASPLEHQATPDKKIKQYNIHDGQLDYEGWEHPEQSGNLGLSWRQYRKMLPNESIAPLPEKYR